MTRQRQIILKAVQENRNHPDANFIYYLLKPEYPELSLGTVYRNLNILSQSGTITKITTPFNREHYDGENHPHYHMFCENCHQIFDLDMDYLSEFDEEVQKNSRCKIRRHELIFHGLCEECHKTEKEKAEG